MTHPIFSRIPFFNKVVDERFLEHRRRSTSAAGIAGALLVGARYEYHWFHDHVMSWELLAVLLVMVTVKLSMMVWYKFHD